MYCYCWLCTNYNTAGYHSSVVELTIKKSNESQADSVKLEPRQPPQSSLHLARALYMQYIKYYRGQRTQQNNSGWCCYSYYSLTMTGLDHTPIIWIRHPICWTSCFSISQKVVSVPFPYKYPHKHTLSHVGYCIPCTTKRTHCRLLSLITFTNYVSQLNCDGDTCLRPQIENSNFTNLKKNKNSRIFMSFKTPQNFTN